MSWLVKNTPDIFNLLLVYLSEYHIESNDIKELNRIKY